MAGSFATAFNECIIRPCCWGDGPVQAEPREPWRELELLGFLSRLCLLILWLFAQPSFFLRAPLCSCFLLFLVLDEQWSRELAWFLLCSIVTGQGANGGAQLGTVTLLTLEWEPVCLWPHSLFLPRQLCKARCGVILMPVVMQAYQSVQKPRGCLDLHSEENQGEQ